MPYVRHRPTITHAIEDTNEGEALVYRVRCACEHLDDTYRFRLRDAEVDLAEHLEAVTPPPEQTCREPKKHKSRPHDRCALCADQVSLPGFEDLLDRPVESAVT